MEQIHQPTCRTAFHGARLIGFLLAIGIVLPLLASEPTIADIAYGADPAQKIDLYLPPDDAPGARDPARPVLVMVHGGGWRSGSKADFGDMGPGLAKLGYVCASVGYRLVTPDGRNRHPAQIDDCQRAVRWLRANHATWRLDPRRFGALGGSAGGHLVALLGTTDARDLSDPELAPWSSRVRCVVDLFGPTDLSREFPSTPLDVPQLIRDLLGTTLAQDPARYREASPGSHVDGRTPPFLIAHGLLDPLVPIEQSRRFHQQLLAAGISSTLLEYPDEAHGIEQTANRNAFLLAVVPFLERNLKELPKTAVGAGTATASGP